MTLDEALQRRIDDQAARARELLALPPAPGAEADDLRALIAGLREQMPTDQLDVSPADEQEAALERLRQRFEARFEALERVQTAVAELREVTSPREMLARAPAVLCAGSAFERAILRETLKRHRAELQSAVRWMSGRLDQLAAEATNGGLLPGAPAQARRPSDSTLVDALTPRELEVLSLLARGQTNLAIARTLMVREGTVKYHVKNILRKLGATSRADAVSRYVRATDASVAR
ncbi:MAG: response regulator transcription factor [Solirubrobacterales bacterium]|nr:response regulator transcription factor [Solirubrobacterales bacterium]